MTVQIFGLVSLMGKQFVDFPTKLLVIDCYLPILPAMQVIIIKRKIEQTNNQRHNFVLVLGLFILAKTGGSRSQSFWRRR